MTDARLLLCTDLDRTLLPNGDAPESPNARPAFCRLVAHPEITLVYVTGRHMALVREACKTYNLPMPDFLIGDVGTTIYQREAIGFEIWPHWHHEIGADWNRLKRGELATLIADVKVLRPQPPEKQNTYKLSYFFEFPLDTKTLETHIQTRLLQAGVKANLVWSRDDLSGQGLLDILPASASKRHAVEFLSGILGFSSEETLYAGDSGNDLVMLTSPVPAVLVANAKDDVRQTALQLAAEDGNETALYCATGGLIDDLNGNYAAGILEGVVHYHPEFAPLIEI